MKNWHNERLLINDTNVDFTSRVPISELMKLFQIATFNHSQKMGLDHDSMQKYSNAFWVVTKMKLVLNKEISSQEKISVTTWTHPIGAVRAVRDCVIKSGNVLKVKGTAEWCCLDYETRNLRKLTTIVYPDLEMEKTQTLNLTFSNLKAEVEGKDKVYSRVVRSTDVDLNNHTNNMKYNIMALDAFSVEELKSFKMKEYEIYFVNESYENDLIDIYKKKIKNYYYIEGKILDKTNFRVVIKFKKK